MLCGRRPFSGKNTASLISAIMRDTPEPVAELKPGLPARIVHLVDACLQKNLAERIQTASRIRDTLEVTRDEILSGQNGVVRPKLALTWPGVWRWALSILPVRAVTSR